MATRVRQSIGVASSQRRAGTELPPYETPSFPLNQAAQRALDQLTHKHSLRSLETGLGEAQSSLSIAAADLNERLTEKEKATAKRKARAAELDAENGGGNNDIEQSLDELRGRVERMTQRMDESVRKMIDGQHSVQSIKDSIAATATNARANASTQASTQQVRSQRRSTADDDDGEEYQDFAPTDPSGGTQAQPTPIAAFRSAIEDGKTKYQTHSLTDRYANNNDYRDFRRIVHDAKHPDGEVTLPHHSEWFNEGRAPAPGVTTRGRAGEDEEDSDEDLAVSRATISTKCPLTLQEFKQPLMSKKCPHSFEAEAILQMIGQSANREGGGRHGERVVQCPVSGCSQTLGQNDLHKDAVLIRQIKRLQRAKELDAEDDDEDGRRKHEDATIIEDGEDDVADVDDIVEGRAIPSTQIKGEPRRTAATGQPTSTAPRGTPAVVELGSSDEDETEEDTMDE